MRQFNKLKPFRAFKLMLLVASISVGVAPLSAFSKDYKVEILVFENLTEHQAYESYQYKQIEELPSESEVWLIEASMLLDELSSFDEAEDYVVIHHFSWGQESLDYAEAASVNIIESELTGWVKVYANQLLYVNLDLDYKGYRLNEKRRIKLDEKHFFDHPKFGILMQVSRLEEEQLDENIEQDFQTNPE